MKKSKVVSSLDQSMLSDCNCKTGRVFQQQKLDYDIVVIGAGISGLCAAVAAARSGVKTALISDRPVLGGSANSEIRVPPIGAANPFANLFARETGILEEIWLNIAYKSNGSNGIPWEKVDEAYFDLVLAEQNLEVFLNTSVFDLEVDNEKIISVKGLQLRAEKIIYFIAETFIDCTGDGVVGYLSGADYRIGRESRSEFDEDDAPDESDRGTMGATLLFTTIDCGHEVTFKAPEWALDVKSLPTLIDPEKMINRLFYKAVNGTYYGFWWAEYGGQIDSIHDDDQVVMHTRKLIYGLWDYVKNSGKFSDVAQLDINWIGYLPGKRESRRLMGPVIVTSKHILGQHEFEDKIGYTGWTIDTHPPCGYMSPEPGSKHIDLPAVSDIPLRCLFSRNIENLWFAGRDVSASHEGLGSLRVIATGGVMGQAAGEAAAYALKNKLSPAQVVEGHIGEVQRLLVRNDQSITSYKLVENNNIARNALVTASSERSVIAPDVEQYYSLAENLCLMLPMNKEQLQKISFYAKVFRETELTVDVYATNEPQNYRLRKFIGSFKKNVADDGWVEFEVNVKPGDGLKFFIVLRRNSSVAIGCGKEKFPGIQAMTVGDDEKVTEETRYHNLSFIPAFKCSPEPELFSAKNVVDGYIRPYGLPHCWCSGKVDCDSPAWLAVNFNKKQTVGNIELVFESDLNVTHGRMFGKVCPEICRDYNLYAIIDGKEKLIVKERDNFQRFRTYSIVPVVADQLKLVVYRTWGSQNAAVYDFRIYS